MEHILAKDLLLEAGFLSLNCSLLNNLPENVEEDLKSTITNEGFAFSSIRLWLTTHRIGIQLAGISDYQSDKVKEIRGPKASEAYDLNNQPTPAAVGFAQAQGMELKDLVTKYYEGENFLFAKKTIKGQSIEKNVLKLIDKLFKTFNFIPWIKNSLFPQPPSYFCAMLDDKLLDVDIDGIKAQNYVCAFEGIKMIRYELQTASEYAEIMKKNHICPDYEERIAQFESSVRTVVPAGHLLKVNDLKAKKVCAFEENLELVLINFDKKFLNLPEAVLDQIITNNMGFFKCENTKAELLPEIVALVFTKNSETEKDIKKAYFERELEKVLGIWNEDIHKLSQQIQNLYESINLKEIEYNQQLNKILFQLFDQVDITPENANALYLSAALIEEVSKTRLAKLFPSCLFSLIFNRIAGVEQFEHQQKVFEQVCDYFNNVISAPSNYEASLIVLAKILDELFTGNKNFNLDCVAKYLTSAKISVDMFKLLTMTCPDFKYDKKKWLKKIVNTEKELEKELKDYFVESSDIDPFSFKSLVDEWKGKLPEELESLNKLFNSIENRFENIELHAATEPQEPIDIELNNKINELNKITGTNYLELYKFFAQEKVNIQACLMNFPSNFEETDSVIYARAVLLKKLYLMLKRLPFIKSNKVIA